MASLRDDLIGHLLARDYGSALKLLQGGRRPVRTLMGLLFHEEPIVRWRAVTMYGHFALAEPDVVKTQLFRILYTLSEESSIVGWASAQAIGEIARVAPELAREDIRPVIHFMDDDEVSLPANRNTVQLAGSIWAIGNIAETLPEMAFEMGPVLTRFIDDPDPEVRGLSIWAICRISYKKAAEKLQKMLDDSAVIEIYSYDELNTVSVGQLARKALDKINGTGGACL
ncbi:MAG TPA: HEAT repeat domain-containing protein [Nitrospirota bacterium]